MSEKSEYIAKVKRFKTKSMNEEKQIECLERKLIDVEQKKKEAYQLIHNLKMQYGKEVNI